MSSQNAVELKRKSTGDSHAFKGTAETVINSGSSEGMVYDELGVLTRL